MSYTATVLPVMLASPGDVLDERRVARDVLLEWNYVHSLNTNAVLMPVGWETHAAPDLSSRPQELINERVLADCDLLIGIFWTRLGTPTGKSVSGTVEEINRHLEAGKPAMVYFSSRPVAPQSIDQDQWTALKEFRAWCTQKGLIETYADLEDFRSKLRQHVQIQLGKSAFLASILNSAKSPDETSGPPLSVLDQLTDTAKELLIEASQDGLILKMFLMNGRYLQTNGKKPGLSEDRREFAKWEFALEQLLNFGLVTGRGQKGEVFELTDPGYRLSDQLKAYLRASDPAPVEGA